MATGNPDGSIVLKTAIDQDGVKKGINKTESYVKNRVKSISKAITKTALATTAVISASIAALTKQAVEAYADYEQLVGGVETLFKDSAEKVKQYADDAFYYAGMSANEYMQTVTSISAALISGLAGDTEKAADIADMAIRDMSDNYNKMGSDAESVKAAYAGFAKQQYQLLDNLKLGYGGTRGEMLRLLKTAESITGTKYDINNLADVYTAIHVIQEDLDITGTTAKEAAKTISGSFGMVKAAWKNLTVAIAGGGDFDRAVNNMMFAIECFADNLLPRIETSIRGIGRLAAKLVPVIVQDFTRVFISEIPYITKSIYDAFIGAGRGLLAGVKSLLSGEQGNPTEAMLHNVEGIADNAKSAAGAVEDLANNTKKAGNEAKRALASFDDLQILSSGGADSAESAESTPTIGGGGGSLFGGIGENADTVRETITGVLSDLMTAIGTGLAAVGLILLFSGNIGAGVAAIVAGLGLVEGGKSLSKIKDPGFEDIKKTLKSVSEAIGGALLAIGILLMFVGQIPLGIGFALAGAAAFGVSAIGDIDPEKLKTDVMAWISGLSSALSVLPALFLVVGILLLLAGVYKPITFGLLVGGVVGLVAEYQADPEAFKQRIVTFLKDNQTAIMALSAAFIVIGAALLLVPNMLPLAIGCLVMGVAGMVGTYTADPEGFKAKLQAFLTENAGMITGLSAAFLVFGIIMLFAGVIPIGIACLALGLAGLAGEAYVNRDAIIGFLRASWDKVVEFWNAHIAKFFTAEWWKELGKKCVNGIAGAFESGINGIIGMFENMINWIVDKLNLLAVDIPDWVPGVGGKSFGFNLPRVNIQRVKMPRLAKGGVVPYATRALIGEAGAEAVLPLERNTEWMDTLAEKIAQRGGNGGQTVILEIDGREFGRAVVNYGGEQNNIHGGSIITRRRVTI